MKDVKLLPPWMRELVHVPGSTAVAGKRSVADRFMDNAFLRSSEARAPKIPSIIDSIQKGHQMGLIASKK